MKMQADIEKYGLLFAIYNNLMRTCLGINVTYLKIID